MTVYSMIVVTRSHQTTSYIEKSHAAAEGKIIASLSMAIDLNQEVTMLATQWEKETY